MSRGRLTSVTDGSYIRHLAPNVCGAGWIIQDKLTGKKVKGSLAEWPSSAESYRVEMLGMLAVLAVRVFLLAVEEYFQQHSKVGEGDSTRVSCDNKKALTAFDKEGQKGTSG